jgi:hypothetical protein
MTENSAMTMFTLIIAAPWVLAGLAGFAYLVAKFFQKRRQRRAWEWREYLRDKYGSANVPEKAGIGKVEVLNPPGPRYL